MKRWLILSLLLLVGFLSIGVHSSLAQQPVCAGPGLNVLAARQVNRTVTMQFSVCDTNGVPINTVTGNAIRLVEDGQIVSDVNFQQRVADQTTPVQAVPLVDGTAVSLNAIGASIGIVFDATQLLNGTGTNVQDNIGAGRVAIEAFLLQAGDPPPPRTVAPGNPERIGLFIPADQPGQLLQPNDLPGFTTDRYAVVNTLRIGLPIRQGKTNLFAAVQAALQATVRDAQQRGGQAIVMVVSDGGDLLTSDAFNTLVNQAVQQNVRILAIGVGGDQALQKNGFRLQQLAESTGGAYMQRPSEQDVGQLFERFVTAQPVTVYEVSYDTAVIDDGRPHQVVLEVTTTNGNFNYTMPITAGSGATTTQLRPVWDVLLRQYFLFAIPALVMITVFTIGIMTLLRDQSIEKAPTSKG
ncbi:MAG: hypothetical protein KatS3mg055_3033 [Chloroflexus sp.]|uniref:VWA domain-containing protein n=1 Tax=Chloroflexus sp. TaxID=1904827 RepID=UPI0021DDE65D|nr:VWA domain-containing protein [Chloroflexus sp.]GIV90515.1 MAG: hypothetical protein KatS3mg055_3033 [Chloroflexus sp.]